MKLNIFNTENEVLTGLAEYFVTTANAVLAKQDRFSVALSGGSSPKKLYELLTTDAYKTKVDWTKIYFFFGDERYVPQTDSNSNYLMAKKALFEPLEIAAANIFPVDTTLEPLGAALQYAEDIANFFAGEPAAFDIVLLGLGDNSHTASLFPYTPVLHDESPSTAAVWLEDQQVFRITINAPMINQAHHIAFLVYGAGKAIAVHHILEDEKDIENYPAQLIVPETGEVQWFLDEPAAANLTKK